MIACRASRYVFAFQASLDSHEDVRAVRGNGGYGRDPPSGSAKITQISESQGMFLLRKVLPQTRICSCCPSASR
jgi:hypothetical protein